MSSHNIGQPLVSIVIPTRDNVKLLQSCIESIEDKSTYKNYEILVVDNGSKREQTKKYLGNIKHKILLYDKPFNYAQINNFAVSHALGEHVIFLNDDTEIISQDWIEKMLEHSIKPNVGAVGALLFYPNDTIQHAGVLIGIGGVTLHAFEGLRQNDLVCKKFVQAVHECSAVTGACLMIKKNLFEQAGGFDEKFAYSFNDIDLCLRLREKGYLIIYTPHSQLYHRGTATRTFTPDDKETRYFVQRWHDLILEGDPYYDKTLSRIRPFEPKMGEEKLVLTDTHLVDKSEQGHYNRLGKYVEISNKIRKHHGTKRMIMEFLRFLKKQGSQE
ncbi:MAG: glycosyltransferase family 2 protein [Thaumarchaeota archaeon]|nr:glycosyltransferase family 2 protein [Nitrososphaerota archaeon]